MSDPFIIWAMRRTGGTTLAALCSSLSEHAGVPHEPFNPERIFGWVTKAWHENRDPQALRDNIRKALEERPLIKHCYEIMPPELNAALREVADDLGYKHVILDRRAEVDRILSLELAKITGAWGGKDAKRIYAEIDAGTRAIEPVDITEGVAHLTYCQKRRQEVDALLEAPFVIYFEDVYADATAGRARVEALLAYLNINPADTPDYEAQLQDALLNRGQNTASIMSKVPNIDAARAALDSAFAACAFSFTAS